MTGVSFSRGGYHRIGKRGHRRRRLHDPPRRPLALRRHRPRLRRRARRRRDHRRLRVRRLRLHLPRRPAVPDRRGRHAGRLRDPRHRARRRTSPATTAPRPPEAERAVGDRVHRVPRCSARATPRRSSASRHGHAVLGTLHVAGGRRPSSPRAPPTGPTAWPAAIRRSSRSPATCSTRLG